MALVETSFADWLKSDSLKAVATGIGLDGWGDVPVKSNIASCISGAAPGDANAEAARQIAFLGPARVIETLRVPRRRLDLIGKCVALTANWPGYEAGPVVFVLGAEEIDGEDGTKLKVIRRLT